MGLEIAQELEGAVRILALRGRLDTDTSADLELAMQDLLGAGERVFLIDLREVGYVSSAGLRVLLAVAKKLEGSKGSMRLCGLNPAVAQVFDVAGFEPAVCNLARSCECACGHGCCRSQANAIEPGRASGTPAPCR